jgi:hypothetical protein
MKVTLDHNCIIHRANQTAIGKRVEAIVLGLQNQCFVVNIGAAETWWGTEEYVLIGTTNSRSFLKRLASSINRG